MNDKDRKDSDYKDDASDFARSSEYARGGDPGTSRGGGPEADARIAGSGPEARGNNAGSQQDWRGAASTDHEAVERDPDDGSGPVGPGDDVTPGATTTDGHAHGSADQPDGDTPDAATRDKEQADRER